MSFVSDVPLPLPGMPDAIPAPPAFQMTLIGQPQPVRIPERLWRSWLDNPAVVARFESKRYRRQHDRCWPWIARVSSTGHGSFRAASLPGPSRRGTVPAHLFAYQLEYGVIPRLGWSNTDDAVLCHQCDFAGCTNPTHLRLGTNRTNRSEYDLRRRNNRSKGILHASNTCPLPAFWLMRGGRQRVVRPHRYALARALGVPLTDDVTALHLCDNPICVRVTLDPHAAGIGVGVRHVVDGTQSQNLLDMGAKGRGGGRRQPGLWYGPDRVARAARSRRLREAVRGGWDEDAVRAAVLDSTAPTLF